MKVRIKAHQKLIQKIVIVTALSFLLFFLVVGIVTNSILENQIVTNTSHSIEIVLQDEVNNFNTYFARLEELGTRSAGMIQYWLTLENHQEREQRIRERYRLIDGAIRTDTTQYESTDISAAFLSDQSDYTEEVFNIILATEGRFDQYARGATSLVFNMYLITRQQFIRIYPKDWALEIESDHDFTRDVFYYIADPEHNPERLPQWTVPYYDSIWEHWMTSLITPIYINDEFFGIVGHDVILDDIYSDILEKNFFDSGYGFIFDTNGNLLIHPFYLDRLRQTAEMGDEFTFNTLDNPQLTQLLTETISMVDDDTDEVFRRQYVEDGHKKYFYTYPLDLLDWYYAIVIPHEEIVEGLRSFRVLYWAGAVITSIFLFAVVISILWSYVLKPIKILTTVTKEISEGNLSKRVIVESSDEIGTLGMSFNEMADKLSATLADLQKDIQKRWKVEQALRGSEQKYKLMVENTLEGVFIHQDREFKFCNQRFAEIFGYTDVSEIITKKVHELVHPKDQEYVESQVLSRENGDRDFIQYSFTAVRKDGSTFELETLGSLIDFEGSPAIQGVARDISETQRLEEQLRQAQKMESIGRLAGGVAHDFNNLLTVIIGHTELAMLPERTRDELVEDILEIQDYAERATQLTHQLLAFSRKQIIQAKIINMNESILQMNQMLTRLLGEKIDLRLQLEENLYSIKADPSQIEQIIVNLAVNSRDAMPNGGVLTISTTNILQDDPQLEEFPDLEDIPHVALSVHDTGSGIPEAEIEHIFEPFYTTKEKGKGTGLGLATVYGIVKQSSGTISVKNHIEKGTVFTIYLPQTIGKTTEEKDTFFLSSTVQGNETILVVEDEEAVRDLVKNALERNGYKTMFAMNGQDAMKLIHEEHESINLVLTDVIMPEMNGTELFEKSGEMGYNLPFLFMSGYTDDMLEKFDILQHGINFINKPFKTNYLLVKLREILDDMENSTHSSQ